MKVDGRKLSHAKLEEIRFARGQGSAGWAITDLGGEGDGALYQPNFRMACGLSIGWLGCTSWIYNTVTTKNPLQLRLRCGRGR
jgi:hypothetical protein